jgi:hypothetical protein
MENEYFVSVTPQGKVSVRTTAEFESEKVKLSPLETDVLNSLSTAGGVPKILEKLANAAFNLGQRTQKSS